MGRRSSSIYDVQPVREIIRETVREIVLPNPNPKNFRIKRSRVFGKASRLPIEDNPFITGRFLLIEINYPDCTNFEGNKILVYEDVTLSQLIKQKSIDPHFTSNRKFKAPIARFIPNARGWGMAVKFCVLMGQLN